MSVTNQILSNQNLGNSLTTNFEVPNIFHNFNKYFSVVYIRYYNNTSSIIIVSNNIFCL